VSSVSERGWYVYVAYFNMTERAALSSVSVNEFILFNDDTYIGILSEYAYSLMQMSNPGQYGLEHYTGQPEHIRWLYYFINKLYLTLGGVSGVASFITTYEQL